MKLCLLVAVIASVIVAPFLARKKDRPVSTVCLDSDKRYAIDDYIGTEQL